MLFIFILLYIVTIRKLKPLSTLQKEIHNLATEEFHINELIDKKDEISQLSNEFYKTAKKLQTVKESRNVFIRNIMHELKTPITKGKFLMNLPSTLENNEKMQKVFYRLEGLINEFSSVEELISTSKIIEKKRYNLTDIVDNTIDILMCEDEEIKKNIKNIKIDVDFKLFSIAIKNLLDNGIKYSTNKNVVIYNTDNELIIENIGDKLKYPLNSYFEPFFKGNEIKSNQSFGLGLYIVKHILDANNKKLAYTYIDNINKFIIC